MKPHTLQRYQEWSEYARVVISSRITSLSGEEMLAKAKFEDAVCISNYPVDIHGKTLQFGNKIQAVDDGRPYYEIPYRTTLVKGFENLMVAGRCIGADFFG